YYDGIGDLDKSLEVFLATLEIDLQLYEQGAEGFDTSYLALDYNNVGYVYNMKGDYVEARNYFEQAFPYLEKDNIENARFLNNIAFSYKEEGKKKQAKSYFFEALNFLNSIPEQRAKYDQLIAIYNNLATVYGEIKPDSAYYYLDLLYQIIPKGEEVEIDLANYYQIRADIDRFLAKHEEAIENSKEALQIRKKLFGNQYPTVSISHIRLGQNYAALHQYEKALEQYQNALSAVIPSFEPQNSIDNPKLENRTTSRDFFLLALKYKAKSLHAIHQAQAAKSTLQLALQLIDQIRYNYLAEGSKYALLERAMPIYEQAIDLAIEMDELEWAFEVAERSKATLLLESIKNSEAQAFAGISEELLEQEREQKVQIAFYERLLNEAEQEEEREKYQRELFDLRQDYQAFLEDLEQAHPEYYELKYEVEYPSVTDLQSELLDEQTALLEYFTGDSSIYLFVLTKQDLQVQQLEKTADFEKNLNTLRKSLSRISDNGFADFTSSSYFIYSNFLQNVLRKLPARISQLLLVPDGQLSYIPLLVREL
ncbi:MAG: tetratricopeptide repeat protein, partial [Bacteroidota bacterium]